MIGLRCFALAVLASPFNSKLRLEAENAVLRHQLIVLRRRLHGRFWLANHDRWFFGKTLQGSPLVTPEKLRIGRSSPHSTNGSKPYHSGPRTRTYAVIPPPKVGDAGGRQGRWDCMRQFKAAWERFAADEANLVEFLNAKRKRC